MRFATPNIATIPGLLACGALLVGCSHDASGDGRSPSPLVENRPEAAASLAAATTPPSTGVSAETLQTPVDPATAKAAWREGVALFDDGDYAAASDRLKTAVAGEPEDAYRRYLLGLSLWKAGDTEGAEAALVESVTLDATRLKGWINLARVRHARGNRTGALEAADRALELDPESADALHQKGRALMELRRGDEALAALTTARGLDPGNGYIANTLGLLLIQLDRPAEAVEPLEAARAVLPHVGYVRNNLAVAYERDGRLDDAKVEYLAAVDAGDASGKAMRSLVRLGAKDTTEPAVTTALAETR